MTDVSVGDRIWAGVKIGRHIHWRTCIVDEVHVREWRDPVETFAVGRFFTFAGEWSKHPRALRRPWAKLSPDSETNPEEEPKVSRADELRAAGGMSEPVAGEPIMRAIKEMRERGADVVHLSAGANAHKDRGDWYCSAYRGRRGKSPPLSAYAFGGDDIQAISSVLHEVRAWPAATGGTE